MSDELKWEGDYVRGSYITFVRTGKSESGKTQVWTVREDQDQATLGYVKWFGRWRTYTFDAEPGMVFEKTCLRQIAQFCEELTTIHRAKPKAAAREEAEVG